MKYAIRIANFLLRLKLLKRFKDTLSLEYSHTRHTFILGLCFFAIWAQSTYRVPGNFFITILPLLGMLTVGLSFIFWAKHLIARLTRQDTVIQAFGRIEWWSNLFVLVFILYSVVIFINGSLDISKPVEQHSKILSISGGEYTMKFSPYYYYWGKLQSWEDPEKPPKSPSNMLKHKNSGGDKRS